MRKHVLALGVSTLACVAAAGSAQALPGAARADGLLAPVAEAVRLICDPQRCYDPQTGAYGQSGCNARGCYPTGPAIGRLGPGDPAYAGRRNARA